MTEPYQIDTSLHLLLAELREAGVEDPCDGHPAGLHRWEPSDSAIGCEDCGSHPGWYCADCYEKVDWVYAQQPLVDLLISRYGEP